MTIEELKAKIKDLESCALSLYAMTSEIPERIIEINKFIIALEALKAECACDLRDTPCEVCVALKKISS